MKNSEDNLFKNEIDMKEFFYALWLKKYVIFFSMFLGAILFFLYSSNIPDKYTSTAVLVASGSESNLSSQVSNYSSLASLAGVSLPRNSSNKSKEAIERIKSFSFFSTHFLPYISLENLIAVKAWVPEENVIIYNENIFNNEKKEWIRNVSLPKSIVPSEQEAYKKYNKILSIEESKNGFVTISLTHHSPIIAKKWVKIIINNINESMREEDKSIANSSISFLNEASTQTQLNAVNEAISQLLIAEMKKLMLSSANKDYIFKVIDSPIAPEYKSSPDRFIITIIGTLFFTILSIVSTLLIYFYKK